jgi:ankyrin repeat protein
LHSAAAKGHKDLVELLLASNASIDVKDHRGVTPAGYAQSEGHQALAELLRARMSKGESIQA